MNTDFQETPATGMGKAHNVQGPMPTFPPDKPWLRAALCHYMVARAGGVPQDALNILSIDAGTFAAWWLAHAAEMHEVHLEAAKRVSKAPGELAGGAMVAKAPAKAKARKKAR